MKKSVVISMLFLYFIPDIIQGQQLPLFSQYRTHQGIINSASITNDYWLHKVNFLYSASYRKQWTGFESSPRTMNIQGLYIKELDNVSLFGGGFILSDKLGRESSTGFYGRLGSIITISDDLFLTAGFSSGVVQYNVNLENVSVFNTAEALAITNQNQTYPDIGFGLNILKKLPDGGNLSMGFSAPQLLGLDLSFNSDEPTEFHIKKVRHFYGLAGYTKKFDNTSIEFSTWIKYVKNVPIHPDFNLRFHYKERGWLGLGYGKGGILFDIGINIDKNLRIGYGFAAPAGGYASSFGSSHEINIGSGIPISREPIQLPPIKPTRPNSQPKVHIIAVGIAKYQEDYELHDLEFTVPSAYQFVNIFQNRGLIEDTQPLISSGATRKAIVDSLKTLADPQRVKTNDMVIFFFSGHGIGVGEKIGICPYNYTNTGDLISDDEIKNIILQSPAKHKICFIEACRNESSGAIIDPKQQRRWHDSRKSIPEGVAYITSTEVGKFSYGNSKGGYFTQAIVEGIEKRLADNNKDNLITIEELFNYVQFWVSEKTKKTQIPQINDVYPRALQIMNLSNN